MKNPMTKGLRTISLRYSYTYQYKVFTIYLEKFVKKFVKLLTNDNKEHDELIPYIDENMEQIHAFHSYLNMYKTDIIKLLTYYYCINRQVSSKYRIYYLDQYSGVRLRVDSKIRHLLYVNFMSNLPDHFKSNEVIHLFLDNLSDFASSMRYGFLVSDITAKTKTTEHWISRLPLFLTCTILVVILKSWKYVLTPEETDHIYIVTDICSTTLIGIVAVFLIFMRVPQSIYADAKKSASDIYINKKANLHLYLLNKTTKENVDKYYERIYNELFLIE